MEKHQDILKEKIKKRYKEGYKSLDEIIPFTKSNKDKYDNAIER